MEEYAIRGTAVLVVVAEGAGAPRLNAWERVGEARLQKPGSPPQPLRMKVFHEAQRSSGREAGGLAAVTGHSLDRETYVDKPVVFGQAHPCWHLSNQEKMLVVAIRHRRSGVTDWDAELRGSRWVLRQILSGRSRQRRKPSHCQPSGPSLLEILEEEYPNLAQ